MEGWNTQEDVVFDTERVGMDIDESLDVDVEDPSFVSSLETMDTF